MSVCSVPPNAVQAINAAVGHAVGFKKLCFFKSQFAIHCCQMVKAVVFKVEVITRWKFARDSRSAIAIGIAGGPAPATLKPDQSFLPLGSN
jgi:hypothetical protein